MGRWEAGTWSGRRAKKSEKMVGRIAGKRDQEEQTQRGTQVHTQQTNKQKGQNERLQQQINRTLEGCGSAVSVLVV